MAEKKLKNKKKSTTNSKSEINLQYLGHVKVEKKMHTCCISVYREIKYYQQAHSINLSGAPNTQFTIFDAPEIRAVRMLP